MSSSSAILGKMVKHLNEAEEDPLTPLIEEYVKARKFAKRRLKKHDITMEEPVRPPGRLSPSAICGCMRAAVFRFTGTPGQDKNSVESELIFENGKWFHHKWQAIARDMEMVLGAKRFKVLGIEQKVTIPELYVAGALDLHVRIKVGKKKWIKIIIDIKSINSYGFNQVMAEQKPLPSHEEQVTAYAKASGRKWGILLYENKNDNRFMVFVFKVDSKVERRITEWCEDTISHLDNETVPPMHPDCKSGTYLFEKCPYAKHCKGKSTDEQLVRIVYRDKKRKWPGTEKAWRRGNSEAS